MMSKLSKKILVIEDDALNRNLFLIGLETKGFETIGAENGLIGIEKVQEYLPDLVICDLVMPDLDGYDVLARLRQSPITAIIPFIFLTASNSQESRRKAIELGADDYISKPCTVDELVRAIAIRLEKHALLKNWYSNHPSKSSPLPDTLLINPESIFPPIPHLKEVFDFIELNYHRGITLSDVADAVGYSPAYLTHQVNKQTGVTVNNWIVKRRIAAAYPLLTNTNQTIEEIATKLGYQDSCYFSRQFRQYNGLSPNTWRKQQQRIQAAKKAKLQFLRNPDLTERIPC
ncbi:DNA-binding response regulator [Cronbergia sp. UHCC 0137]|uniref:response regulator transcription factor n=1 Tax=Cronbergia sp. UHCC 0137 TaxID=3110239 RepID=UPI002B211518|nr:DNA-binding response regulator [Cronbergia sp. UHCC 0137]MEA5619767.1 DNA-binding response regulator [Cronbergia sp. UHCC 0137]